MEDPCPAGLKKCRPQLRGLPGNVDVEVSENPGPYNIDPNQ